MKSITYVTAVSTATILVSGLAASAAAQTSAVDLYPFQATSLSLSAQGEARVPPDMATITLGVDTTETTAVKAMAANAARMTAVISKLKETGISDQNVQTSNVNLSPQYLYDQGQPPRLTGYQASNQVTVRVNDLTRLGNVVDAVVSAGATSIGQISFGLVNPLAAQNRARIAAVKALADEAELYAQATGYRISRLVNLREGSSPAAEPQRPVAMMSQRKGAPPTPIEASEVQVQVEVSGVYELTK
jgi:hypothetical protein